MPYRSNKDLPPSVSSHLPQKAQDIYREAFNSAYTMYGKSPQKKRGGPQEDLDKVAAKIAWSAVKKEYAKADGEWERKGSSKSISIKKSEKPTKKIKRSTKKRTASKTVKKKTKR
jgi:cation transport regulator